MTSETDAPRTPTAHSPVAQYFRWSFLTMLGGALAIVGLSYHINAYGLFGDVSHESLVAYRGERTTKYLFSYNYVPARFDSLLIGASAALNWNTKRIRGHTVYNAAISGANMSEEGLIAEQVMRRRKLAWLVIALQPYLTMTHGRRTEYMTPSEYWSAFGSINLFFLESSKFLAERHWASDAHNDYGDSNYSEGLSPIALRAAMNDYIRIRRASGKPNPNFNVAPGAVDDLVSVISQARSQQARILVVDPPVYRGRFEAEQADWEHYWAWVRPLFPSDTVRINFNSAEYDAMRGDLDNFQDAVHLSRRCSDAIVDEIARVMTEEDKRAAR